MYDRNTMCRLFAFSFTESTTQQEKLECLNSFRKLAVTGAVLASSESGHQDGWGISLYKHKDTTPHIYKSIAQALEDKEFKAETFFSNISLESGLAHLRKKTVGEASLLNTHPFIDGKYSFIHNGTIAKETAPYEELSALCEGATDSERLFRRFLEIKNSRDISTLQAFTIMIEETKTSYTSYSAINTVLHDGDYMYVSRVINTHNPHYEASAVESYYTLYLGATPNGDTVISSEEIAYKDITYTLLPNNSISVIPLSAGSVEIYQLA